MAAAVAAAALLLLIIFQIAGDVVSRNVLNQPFKGTVPRVEVLLVSFGALCLAPAERIGNHVSMELLIDKLPFNIRRIFDITVYVIVFFLLLWMTYSTAVSALESYQRGEKRVGIID